MGGRHTNNTDASVDRSAVFSPCRTWRYSLKRVWCGGPPLVVIGLNPSTADETKDDPTIRRCIGFARREGCGALIMLNLFAFRATDPRVMKAAADPVGPQNDAVTAETCAGRKVVAAWGHHGRFRERDLAVVRALGAMGVSVLALGTTKDGSPRHPLYVKAEAPLEQYEPVGMLK